MPRGTALGTLPAVRSLPIAIALVLALVAPAAASAQAAPAPQTGLVFTGSLAGGAETGLKAGSGKPGLLEAEGTVGYELESVGLRPEMGLALGMAPSAHVGLRPGLRWTIPDLPIQLRGALDWSNVRDGFRWRWLLLGVAYEVRMTSLFGVYGELDSGVPLAGSAGMPLLLRVGASFRL